MGIHDRIKEVIKAEGVSMRKFEQKIGVKRNSLASSIRNERAISHLVIAKIVKTYPNHSPNWLVLGDSDSPKEKMLDKIIEIVKG